MTGTKGGNGGAAGACGGGGGGGGDNAAGNALGLGAQGGAGCILLRWTT